MPKSGFTEYFIEQFLKCESVIAVLSPEDVKTVIENVRAGDKEAIKWVRMILKTYNYDFGKERHDMEKQLESEIEILSK